MLRSSPLLPPLPLLLLPCADFAAVAFVAADDGGAELAGAVSEFDADDMWARLGCPA